MTEQEMRQEIARAARMQQAEIEEARRQRRIAASNRWACALVILLLSLFYTFLTYMTPH